MLDFLFFPPDFMQFNEFHSQKYHIKKDNTKIKVLMAMQSKSAFPPFLAALGMTHL
jgi:hypothetical protein